MGQRTALAVAGAPMCVFGITTAQFGGFGLGLARLTGILGVAVSFAGFVLEGEIAQRARPESMTPR